MNPRILIILGPTAVGKSETALTLAERLGGEIVNADSQQVYRYMDIGTGKPSLEERERIPHHLIDIVDPDEEFNAARFRELAAGAIARIHDRQRHAIVCGGTGLYLKALTRGLFEGPAQAPELRAAYEREISERGLGVLYQRLLSLDPSAASSIHPHDRQRTIRALEVFELTGKPLSYWQREHAFAERPYETLKIGLNRERGELYDLIDRRSDRMVEQGFLDEVRSLLARGYSLDLQPLRSVGYRQMGRVLRGEQELAPALDEMKQETRRLAKRQLTWFRGDPEVVWYHPDEGERILGAATAFFGTGAGKK
jgi:tRNA dimethylallyltransferase